MDCNLDIEVCSDWILSDRKKQAWEILSTTHYAPNVFLTVNWLKLWWKVFSKNNDELHIIYIWKNNEIIAIVPIYLQGGSLVKFIGTGEAEADEVCSEYLDVLINNEDRHLICSSIVKCFKQLLDKGFSFELDNVLADSHLLNIIQLPDFNAVSIIKQIGSRYFIPLPASYQEYENSCSKSFMSQARRKMRKFKKLNGEIIQVNTQNDLNFLFNELAELHNTCWIDKGYKGVFSSEKFMMFHFEFASTLLEQGNLSMKALKLNGHIIGVIYNFVFCGEKTFYQMGIDNGITQNISIGTLLHLLEIESSINNKERIYDFMKGDEKNSYKSAYTNHKIAMYSIRLDKKSLSAYLVKYVIKTKKMIGNIKKLHSYADSSGFNVGRTLARHFDGINADIQGK